MTNECPSCRRPLYDRSSMRKFLDSSPKWLRDALGWVTPYAGINWLQGSDEDFDADQRRRVLSLAQAEALGSASAESQESTTSAREHTIMLDIDCGAALIPSTNNQHLYFNAAAEWSSVLKLLDAMEECGILEQGYVASAKARGETYLRAPWINKGAEKKDAERAFSEWLNTPATPWLKRGETFDEWIEDPLVSRQPFRR